MSEVKEGVLEYNGLSIRYVEAGEGRPVVVFPADRGVLFNDIAAEVATHHRVLMLDASASGLGKVQDFAENLAQALAQIGVASFSIIGVSQGSTAALAQAVCMPDQVQRLVLVSPLLASVQHPELGDRFREIRAPTLVLVGTHDRSGSREAGHILREQIPACHLLLVYDAGHAIVADRHEACLSPI